MAVVMAVLVVVVEQAGLRARARNSIVTAKSRLSAEGGSQGLREASTTDLKPRGDKPTGWEDESPQEDGEAG